MIEDLVAQRYLHIQLDEAMVWLGDVITREDQTHELLLMTSLHCGVHSRKGSSRIGNDQPKKHTQTMHDEALTWSASVTKGGEFFGWGKRS